MSLIWILIAALLGFGVAFVFAGVLKLPRNIFLLIYVPLVLVLLAVFLTQNKISLKEILVHNWYWGIIGAVLAGIFVIRNVFSQPSSPRNTGFNLFVDITWSGLLYGLADALLLSVLPIIAVNAAFANSSWVNVWYGRIGIGIISMVASLFVTTAYHLGYPEFRGKRVIWPNVGNGVLSLAYILSLNPLAAVLPHMAMHIAAMLHGRETTGQVPPHYTDQVISN